jgi:response regulator NasT
VSAEPAQGLTIVAADEDRRALSELAEMLSELGHEVTAHAVGLPEAGSAIAREDPDLAIVVLHEDPAHALALISEILSYASGPVVALAEGDDPEFVARAADLGIFALAQPATPAGVQGAIDVAVRRHAERERLEEKVDQLESALERRAVIERAKGILMERHGIDERQAFDRLRSHARSHRVEVVAVARAVAEGHALLPGG